MYHFVRARMNACAMICDHDGVTEEDALLRSLVQVPLYTKPQRHGPEERYWRTADDDLRSMTLIKACDFGGMSGRE